MIERIIEVGNKIDIEYLNSGTKEKTIYKSQVFEIMDNDEIRIAMPFDENRLVVLSLNLRYKMCFYTKSGLFECVAYVLDRYKSDNRFIAVVSLKTGLKKIQRKEFFRLEKLIDVDYRILSEEESNYETVQDIIEAEAISPEIPIYKNGIAVDLSGGGSRLVLEDAYPVSTFMSIRLHIGISPQESVLNVIGKVVMSEKELGKPGKCENRVEFVKIKEKEREKLIHYIFNEERKLRRNRKS